MPKIVQFSFFKLFFKCENVLSFRGPSPLTPGLQLPLDPTKGSALRLPYEFALRAHHMPPPFPFLNSWICQCDGACEKYLVNNIVNFSVTY